MGGGGDGGGLTGRVSTKKMSSGILHLGTFSW